MTVMPGIARQSIVKKAALACIVAAAIVAAFLPWPEEGIERWYSTGVYPVLQRLMTSISNRAPFALADVAVVGAIAAWLLMMVSELRDKTRDGLGAALGRVAGRTVVAMAAIYLAFLGLWGLNYRRIPLEKKLGFDAGALTPAAAWSATLVAVSRANALHAQAHAAGWPPGERIDPSLAAAFSTTARDLGGSARTIPGRPKPTLLNLYFRPAGVDGATDPFFLETLMASDLLPFERPFVVAHEWSHLAGFADEGEANFMGWLTCARASAPAQYSGWLFLYGQLAHDLPRREREDVIGRLAAGPRDDLRAVAARLARDVRPRVSAAGWRVYDKYLKANHVEAGAASYAQVVRLVLGTALGQQASSN
jgi:Protein of unknown function (DUF3810)